ncbi:hypothetical protein AB0I28_16885 [Phytomonospora sp. NPDC050363]|uniref:hypothetical protein n=1 Tax=Phytomonospora sp. NPDC050363 TaxID=3155642 RepID=UPI0033FEF012
MGMPWDQGYECASSNTGDDQNGMCALAAIAVPSTRTNYYMADGQTRYQSYLTLTDSAERYMAIAEPAERVYTPGTYRGSMGTGPYSPGAGLAQEMVRYNDVLYFQPHLLDNDDDPIYDTFGEVFAVTGTAVVTKDGAEINRIDGDLSWFDTGLPPGESGRYRPSLEGTLDVPWTPLGTRNTLDWEFDSVPGPADTSAALPFSVVEFDAEGVVNGTAARDKAQQVELDYTPQPGAPDTAATSMTFEVSYDDGATWKKVALDRTGDHATATLRHPKSAEYVSVRMSATGDDGTKITHSTVRSYVLRQSEGGPGRTRPGPPRCSGYYYFFFTSLRRSSTFASGGTSKCAFSAFST